MMMGLYFMKEVPFHTVYIHALVRDEKGQKMSKTKGNVIDPLELTDEYGADALRFTLAAMAAQGRDIKLAKSRIEGYRNFGTKLWNAARFLEMNGCAGSPEYDPAKCQDPINRWIVGEVEKVSGEVSAGIEAYRFNEAAAALYHFLWHIFCDWYLELIKSLLQGGDQAAQAEARATAAWTLDQALKLLHPFMPFITEELWARLAAPGTERETMLIVADWPLLDGLADNRASQELEWVIQFVSDVRSVRAEMNVPAGAKIPVIVTGANDETSGRIERYGETMKRLARIDRISLGQDVPKGSIQIVLNEAMVALPLEGVIDFSAESARLEREIEKVGSEIDQLSSKLGNTKFISRAPEHVIEEQRERKADAEATAQRLKQALKRLEATL